MTLRTLRIITFTFVSHLLLAPLAFTSQLPESVSHGADGAPSTEVTIRAQEQEKQGEVYKLNGDVEISFQSYVLRAEHVTYDSSTGAVDATGRVVFDGGPHNAHLVAGRASYNVKDETGTFYDVSGTFGAVVRGSTVVLTTNNPFVISGREVRKTGANRYLVLHGTITSCPEPTPTWTFNAEKIDLVAGEDAKIYHSSFRLMKLPIFYFPYAQAPGSATSRTSGFLLPALGQSSTKGFIFGDSVYWAINRSNDITLGAEYFSARGWSQTAEVRMRPSESSSLDLHYFGVLDRERQGGEDVRLIGETTLGHWRGSADIEYLSSFLFRQAFSETYSQAVNSEVKSEAYLSHNQGGYSLNANAGRYQNFYQANSDYDQIRILHLPTAEANALERHVPDSPLVWSVNSSVGGLQRSEPGFVTANVVGRVDLSPRLALPLHWGGWQVRPELALHDTLYSQRNTPSLTNPLGEATGNELNRRAVEAVLEIRPPALERVSEGELFGHKLKHVIEPIITYRYTGGIDQFQNTIRFDALDVLSNTSELEYDIVQRVYGRRRSTRNEPGCEPGSEAQRPASTTSAKAAKSVYIPGVSAVAPHCEDESGRTRELLTWELKQKFYFDRNFGGALVPGQRNVFTNTADLTAIAFLDDPRSWSPLISRLRLQTSANTDVQWQLDYDPVRGRINSSAAFVEYRRGEYFVGGSHSYFHLLNPGGATPASTPQVFNQFRYLAGYGHPNKRGFAGGFSAGYDQNRNFLQYGAAQTSYNLDCCGLSFEFRRLALPGVRNENQYRFAFTLANIGTFGNMRKQERLY